MIDGLIRWSLRHRAVVVALAAAFLVWGAWTASRMPLDVLPDLTAPTVTILAEAPGMDPLEIESLVTFPIESALNGAAGVRRVRSATAVGVAVVWVEFDWGQDIAPRAADGHREADARVGLAAAECRAAVPGAGVVDHGRDPVRRARIRSALAARAADDRPRPSCGGGCSRCRASRRSLPPAASRSSTRSWSIRLRLAAHQVTLDDVEHALAAANRNATAGFQVAEGQEYLVRGVGRLADIDAIARGRREGDGWRRRCSIRDVGTVREGAAIKRGEGSHNARPAVIIGIQKQPAVNTLELTERIDATLDDIQRALPPGMRIDADLFRQADFIEQSLHNLFTALLEGAGARHPRRGRCS